HIMLYLIGFFLLVFGHPNFWDKITEADRKKRETKRIQQEAAVASAKPFEVQELVFDTASNTWKNKLPYFQTIHVGQVNLKAFRNSGSTTVETNDDENASDSL
ncbi:hypothetical protein M8994_22915, partial [Brucella sp. 21LCYQ03]|nr:hypothetical protein [Brucella sp. 21LCYQ03]